MRIINSILIAATAITIAACASVGNPEGGAKDTTPPTLVSSNPKDQQLNVNSNSIRLEFNEPIQQINLQRELLITPNVQNKYRIRFRDNVMELLFERPFQDSTTYIFNFREGIADITEKNIARNLKLSFSTGSFIDSSRVSGRVVTMLNQEAEKDAIVALYRIEDTLNIRKNKPYYQTQANANGEYSFENVKQGTYRIFAIQDANKNSLQEEIERVGFKTEPITVTPDSQTVLLQTALIDTRKPIAMQRQRFLDRLAVNYGEGVINLRATIVGTRDTVTHKITPDGKVAELFRSNVFKGGRVLIAAADSAGNTTQDTINVEFGTDYTQRVQGAQLKVANRNQGAQTYRPGQKITIEFQGQIRVTGKTPLAIQADTANSTPLNFPDQVKLDPTQTELSFTLPRLASRQQPYNLVLDSTQIVPVHGKRIAMRPLQITIAEAQGFGSVKGTIAGTQPNFIIQLLNQQNQVITQTRNQRTFIFRDVTPGTYKIRVILDANNNGRWDQGSPDFKKEPEQVYIHPQPIEIRANWELEDIRIQL